MKESKNENLSALITEGDIQQLIADIKGTAPETLSVVKGFMNKLDSVTLMQAVKALEENRQELYPTLLFEYPTIQNLQIILQRAAKRLPLKRPPSSSWRESYGSDLFNAALETKGCRLGPELRK